MGKSVGSSKLGVGAFLDNPCVKACLSRLDRWKERAPPVSNIVDGAGNQYVDLVMQGGGTLGIALVGYTYALEHAGIRFKSIGGTSAGAINATLLAGLDVPAGDRSERVLEAIAQMDMDSFLDSPRTQHKRLVLAIASKKIKFKIGWHAVLSFGRACKDLGLHPGEEFERWLAGELAGEGVKTCADLKARMSHAPDGFEVQNWLEGQSEGFEGTLKMVAADITTMTKAEFPKLAGLYFRDPDQESPARFVRASMSIPLVFFPYHVRGIPQGDRAKKLWRSSTSYESKIPESIRFVDGGILSNFPISLFHPDTRDVAPRCPTIGVRLGPRRKPNTISSLQHLATKSFDTARSGADYDFLARNREYRHLVQRIDTGEINWLDFNLPDDQQIELFKLGVLAATHFLVNRFDWGFYQCVRAEADGRELPEGCHTDDDGRVVAAGDEPPGPDHPTPEHIRQLLGEKAESCLPPPEAG